MKERILSKDLSLHIGKKVLLKGWLNNVRSLGKISFLLLRDRTGFTQVLIEKKEEILKVEKLQVGSILSIEGTVASSQEASLQVEIIHPTIIVENPIHSAPPVEYYKPTIPSDLDFILDHRAISLRNRELAAVFTIQSQIAHAYRLYMHDHVGATEYFAPNILGASSEGGAEFFTVDYFGYPATLAQSSQLYKQIMVGVHERVFAIMPFFRAEPSHTPRHLSEGKQFEFEIGFINDWREILDIQEGCIKFMIDYLQNHAKEALKILKDPLVKAPAHIPFPRLTFQEAQELYYQRTKIDERAEPDLSPAAEKELCKWALETHGTDFIFVTDWKTSKRAFYSYPNPDNPDLTNTFDLLCAGTEITSGGQRRHTYDSMVEGILSKEMNPEHFTDYLSIFQYGMPPHGGFGMGLERLTMTLLGLKNIREASLFPSDTKRIASNKIKAHIFFGGENIRNEIIRLCRSRGFTFEHHPHIISNENEGIKALILVGKSSKKNYQFNIQCNRKLDLAQVTALVGEKCEFEKPPIIEERFGLIVGGVPPFGSLLNIETYFDEDLQQASQVTFSCGLPAESITMQAKDLIALVNPTFVKCTKIS